MAAQNQHSQVRLSHCMIIIVVSFAVVHMYLCAGMMIILDPTQPQSTMTASSLHTQWSIFAFQFMTVLVSIADLLHTTSLWSLTIGQRPELLMAC